MIDASSPIMKCLPPSEARAQDSARQTSDLTGPQRSRLGVDEPHAAGIVPVKRPVCLRCDFTKFSAPRVYSPRSMAPFNRENAANCTFEHDRVVNGCPGDHSVRRRASPDELPSVRLPSSTARTDCRSLRAQAQAAGSAASAQSPCCSASPMRCLPACRSPAGSRL